MSHTENHHSGHARRHHRRLNPLFLITVLAAVLVVLILVAVLLNLNPRFYKVLTVEAGGKIPAAQSFLADNKDITLSYGEGIDQIDTSVPGDYPVKLCWEDKSATVTLRVSDTVAPTGTAQDLTALQIKMPEAKDFVTNIADATDVTVRYETEPVLPQLVPQLPPTVTRSSTSASTRIITATPTPTLFTSVRVT